MSHDTRKAVFGVSDQLKHNAACTVTEVKSLKFLIQIRRLYYPSSENKGTDQLCSYSTADLRLCFRVGNNSVFSRCGSYHCGDNQQEGTKKSAGLTFNEIKTYIVIKNAQYAPLQEHTYVHLIGSAY